MVLLAVTAGNLILGAGRLYVAPFGTTEPTDASVTPNGTTTPPSSPWTDVGGTDGGVTYEVDTTYTPLNVDQIPMEIGARLTDMKIQVTTKMSEITFANLQVAFNSLATTSVGSGYQTMDLQPSASSMQPTYAAAIIDGWAPLTAGGVPALRRVIVRKVLSTAKAALVADKKSQQSLEVTMQAYWVSPSISAIHWVDQTA